MGATAAVQSLPRYSSTAAVSLFMRCPDTLEEIEREHLIALQNLLPIFLASADSILLHADLPGFNTQHNY